MTLAPPTAATREPLLSSDSQGWQARLDLRFCSERGRTVLRKEHRGPLLVQRPFYPGADGTCHVYVIHPPGGIVGGDRIELRAEVGPGAGALLTTPGATKLYRTAGRDASQAIRFTVSDGGRAEWLPLETIAFSGCRADLSTRVDLDGTARFIGWEILCLGRPASRSPFVAGGVRQSLIIRRDGAPLLWERGLFDAGAAATTAAWGLGGHPVTATLAATTDDATAVAAVRTALGGLTDRFAVTELRGVLVCRYVGPSAAEARSLFRRAWEAIHLGVMGSAAVAPRIWAT